MWRLGLLLMAVALAAPTYANPVIPGDHPDPSIVRAGGAFYASATTSSWAPMFPVFRSTDLVAWQQVGAVLPAPPRWASGKFWAPELAHDGKLFYAYWGAARHGGRPCIGLSTAERAQGPWHYRGRVACPAGGAIDAAPFRDRDGSRWLLWKALGPGRGIMVQRLTPDGQRVSGPATQLLAPDAPWEQGVTEAPSLMRLAGQYVLFYSGGHCCRAPCSYAEGVARAAGLLGPYIKHTDNPILRGDGTWKCPGHGTVVRTGATGLAFLHHGFRGDDAADLRRQVLLDPLGIGPDGWPTIGTSEVSTAVGVSPLGAAQVPAATGFDDAFSAVALEHGWEWLFDAAPDLQVADGALTEHCGGPLSFVARQVPVDRFTAVASIDAGRGDAAAGLAVVLGRGVRGIEVRHAHARAFVAGPQRTATGPSVAVRPGVAVRLIIGLSPGGHLATYVDDGTRPLVRVPAGPAAEGSAPTRVALTCRFHGAARFAFARVRPS